MTGNIENREGKPSPPPWLSKSRGRHGMSLRDGLRWAERRCDHPPRQVSLPLSPRLLLIQHFEVIIGNEESICSARSVT